MNYSKHFRGNLLLQKPYLIPTVLIFVAVLGISILLSTPVVFAADDPLIKGDLRQGIMESMMTHIENRLVNDTFYIYDGSQGKILKLKYDKLHEGIVKRVFTCVRTVVPS